MANLEPKIPSYALPTSVLSVLNTHKVLISNCLILPPEACGIKVNFPLTTISLQTARFETPFGDTLVINSTYATADTAGTDDSGWLAYQTLAWASGSIVAFFITQDALKNTRVFDHVHSVIEELDQKELEKRRANAREAKEELKAQTPPEQTPATPTLWEATLRGWINSTFGVGNILDNSPSSKSRSKEGAVLKFKVFTNDHEFVIRSVYHAPSSDSLLKPKLSCSLQCIATNRKALPGESTREQVDGPKGIFSEALFQEIVIWMLQLSLIPPVKSQQSQEEDDDDY